MISITTLGLIVLAYVALTLIYFAKRSEPWLNRQAKKFSSLAAARMPKAVKT